MTTSIHGWLRKCHDIRSFPVLCRQLPAKIIDYCESPANAKLVACVMTFMLREATEITAASENPPTVCYHNWISYQWPPKFVFLPLKSHKIVKYQKDPPNGTSLHGNTCFRTLGVAVWRAMRPLTFRTTRTTSSTNVLLVMEFPLPFVFMRFVFFDANEIRLTSLTPPTTVICCRK